MRCLLTDATRRLMSETLRTDTLLIAWDMNPEPKVLIEHARQLERALNAANRHIEELNSANQHIEKLKRAGNELAALANGIYQLTHLLSLEQYKQIKRDLK